MLVGLLGDTHGHEAWMLYAIDKFRREGVNSVLQVGDLGIDSGPRASRMWDKTNNAIRSAGQIWYVTPGNHENYDLIDSLESSTESGLKPFRSNIILLPRGYRWEWDGMKFVSIGGAPSVDRAWRVRDEFAGGSRKWWPQEAITPEDVALVAAGGYADVMISHDAPHGLVQITQRISGNPGNFEEEDLEYAAAGRAVFTEAFKAVKPALLVHGHYHFKVDEIYEHGEGVQTRVMGMPAEPWGSGGASRHALGSIDTLSEKATFWDVKDDYLNRHALKTDDRKDWKKYEVKP